MDISSFVIGHSKGYSNGKKLSGVVSMKENEAGGMSYELRAKEGDTFDIAYGNTEPQDTTKLWVKRNKASNIKLMSADFENIARIGTLPENLGGCGSVVVDSQIYLFGGKSGQNSTDVILKFDPATRSTTTLSVKLPWPAYLTRVSLHGTNAYLFQCVNGYTYLIYKFDVLTQIITTINTRFPVNTWGLTVVNTGAKTYLFGGETSDGKLDTIQEFDPETETLVELETKLHYYSYGMAAGVVGSKVYLFGGAGNTTATGSNLIRSDIYMFDIETMKISKVNTSVPGYSGYTLSDYGSATVGKSIYLFGGRATNAVNPILKFDTEMDTITTLSMTLPTAVFNISTAVIGEKVYLFGGMRATTSASSSIVRFVNDIALSKTEMAIMAGTLDNAVQLADNVTMGIGSVYSSNEYGIAEPVEAYLYKDGEWTLI